jgi:hypothetical protein
MTGIEEAMSNERRARSVLVHPNPFVCRTAVKGRAKEQFVIYDISGKLIGTYRGDRIGVGLAAGVYFVKPESGQAAPQRIVKVR